MNFFCFGVSYLQIQQTKTRQTTEVLLSHITAVLQVSIQWDCDWGLQTCGPRRDL